MEKCIVLCSDDCCRHNSGGGYYGVCHHPDNENRPAYCGIDRTYQSSCSRREPIALKRAEGSFHPELLDGYWKEEIEID